MFEIERELTFSACHQLRGCDGSCERLHGHNFRVRVRVVSHTLNEAGMVMDFRELSKLLKSAVQSLDHRHLNELDMFRTINPSSENIAKFIGDQVAFQLRGRAARLKQCDVFETDKSRAGYLPEDQ
jgi:6-pyruvoyltetrahydropterin/6-carboxytetrahydropterin synthase